MNSQVMPTYARLPVTFERGQGVWLWDNAGKRYLDALSGIAVCSLGHAHPAVRAAVCDQAGQLVHTSNLYHVALQERLAQELCSLSGLESAFFCNSGAEANEAALKIARRFAQYRGVRQPLVIVMESAFHGRTLATLSATGNAKVQEGFAPLVQGFLRLPYDDIPAVEAAQDPDIVALLVEPIQGEGGVRLPADGYLNRLRQICTARNWLLMLDEVQTGIGRTGRWFAFQHENAVPDVLTLAKALGNGVPIGACLARGAAAAMLSPGKHGSTFGGNPLACRAAQAVLQTIRDDHLLERVSLLGERLTQGFRKRLADNPCVLQIRGRGLMLGIELDRPCSDLVLKALDAGLLINVTADRVVRLLPPFILDEGEADLLIDQLSTLIAEYTSAPSA